LGGHVYSLVSIAAARNIRAAYYFHLAEKINDDLTRIAIDCD